MARLALVTLAVAASSVSGVAQAAERPENPWHEPRDIRQAPNFDIPNEIVVATSRGSGSRIIAGAELIPNTMVGFGMFGQKADKSPHAPAVERELALPKSRKAALGLSFRF